MLDGEQNIKKLKKRSTSKFYEVTAVTILFYTQVKLKYKYKIFAKFKQRERHCKT